jgi:hypothetical protein
MKPGDMLKLAAGAALLLSALPAAAQAPAPPNVESDKPPKTLGMDPQTPAAQALPGGTSPRMGEPAGADWRFDFHGILIAPLRVGFGHRPDARPMQSKLTMHSPPVVPDDLETFSHTGVVPTPYGQLNFSYGNEIVTGTASIVAHVPNVSSGFFDPASQPGIYDLFLTVLPKLGDKVKLSMNFGAFTNRYGSAGEYDEGRYGTPLIARINGVGEHMTAAIDFDDITLLLEQGIVGQANKASSQIMTDGWNDFADPREGSSFAAHFHAGIGYKQTATLGLHSISTWSQDERATGSHLPDGRLNVFAGDLRLTLGRFGHLYTAFSHVQADYARTVGRIIRIMNARGGKGLMDNYLGPGSAGNGTLNILGAQYDLSVGRLVSYPVPFGGDGPDILVSLFFINVGVESDDKLRALPTAEEAAQGLKGLKLWDHVNKLKYGAEATYSFLPWMAAGLRFDQVAPNLEDGPTAFAVVSPRVIFRTNWQSHDQVVLQYSHWFDGSRTTVRNGYPPREDPSIEPDKDMLSISAAMWW